LAESRLGEGLALVETTEQAATLPQTPVLEEVVAVLMLVLLPLVVLVVLLAVLFLLTSIVRLRLILMQ